MEAYKIICTHYLYIFCPVFQENKKKEDEKKKPKGSLLKNWAKINLYYC